MYNDLTGNSHEARTADYLSEQEVFGKLLEQQVKYLKQIANQTLCLCGVGHSNARGV